MFPDRTSRSHGESNTGTNPSTTQGATPNVIIGINNIGDGIDQILENTTTRTTGEISSAVATETEIDTVISGIITSKRMAQSQENFNKVLTTSAHLVQIGATSPKFASMRMITDYGIEVKTSDLRESCSRAGITVRKFSRGIRNVVIKVATKLNIEGNLAKNYKMEFPTCDKQDLIWVSDFQTFSDNPAMPDQVKTWLLQNYKNRFRPEK